MKYILTECPMRKFAHTFDFMLDVICSVYRSAAICNKIKPLLFTDSAIKLLLPHHQHPLVNVVYIIIK